MMSISTPTKGHVIFRVLLYDVLRLISTFKGGFDKLMLGRKSMLLVADISTNLFRNSLELHKYKSDLYASLLFRVEYVSSPESTSLIQYLSLCHFYKCCK